MRRKVNLFLVGAAKCGTSGLHKDLSMHPDICMSNPKEPYYFELEKKDHDDNFYTEKYFRHLKNETIIGEARHRNMFFTHIAEGIHEYNPNANIIFMLRDPVPRAYSHWLMWNRLMWIWFRVPGRSFAATMLRQTAAYLRGVRQVNMGIQEYEKALSNASVDTPETFDRHTIVETGFYYQAVKRFTELFGRHNVLIIDFDDYVRNKAIVLTRVTHFLGVAPFEPGEIKMEPVNANPKYISRTNVIVRKLKAYIPGPILNFLYRHKKTKARPDVLTSLLLKIFYAGDQRRLRRYREIWNR